jgi:mRNA interferase MazF
VIIVPMTSTRDRYRFRVRSNFGGREGDLAIDQVRTIDRSRLIRRLGVLDGTVSRELCDALVAMFDF